MEEMEEACKKALLTVDRIQKELVFQESLLEEKNSSLSSVRASLQARYLEQNTAKLSLRQLNQKKEELTESSADMNLENRQLEEQMREIRRILPDSWHPWRSWRQKIPPETRRSHPMECFLRRRENQREEASRALSQIQLEAAGLKQQDLPDENLSRLEEETGRLLAEQKALGSGSGDSEQAVKERLLEIEAIKEQICAVQRRPERS